MVKTRRNRGVCSVHTLTPFCLLLLLSPISANPTPRRDQTNVAGPRAQRLPQLTSSTRSRPVLASTGR